MAQKTEQQLAEWMAAQIRAHDAGALPADKVAYLDQHIPDWYGAWSRLMSDAPISDEQIWEVLLDGSRRYARNLLSEAEVSQLDGLFGAAWRTPEAIAQAAVTA